MEEENGKVEYPKPLSPPYPEHSRQVELDRAKRAEAASSAGHALSRDHFLYEDDCFVAVNKPCGVYSDHVLSTLHHLLTSENASNLLELHLANRLDRDTSGVMIITKQHKIAAKFVKAYTERRICKTYLALCICPSPTWNHIYIKSGHGRSKYGAWRTYSKNDVGKVLPGGSIVRDMSTLINVLSINGFPKTNTDAIHDSDTFLQSLNLTGTTLKNPDKITLDGMNEVVATERLETGLGLQPSDTSMPSDEKNDIVLLRAYPLTGRTHQIRLHCQYVRSPIRGDVKYGGVLTWKDDTFESHALHAETVCFEHPVTGNLVKLHAPLPEWALKSFNCTVGR